jgi:predicted amidohydrolase
MDVLPDDKKANRDKMVGYIEDAAKQGVQLIVFPEECLTGFGTAPMQVLELKDLALYRHQSELVPEGESTQIFIELAKKHHMYICWGMAERDPERFDVTYNAAVLVGPEGFVGKYHKVHLPLTERLIHQPGTGPYPVFDTELGKIGILVCFDKAYPEPARAEALQGAQIILLPTAWPSLQPNEDDNDYKLGNVFSFARASENMIFWVDSCASGMYMMGHSRIIGPNPQQIFATTGFEEGMAVAEVDIEAEIEHAQCFAMGGSNLVRDRKPLTYGELTKPNKWCVNQGLPPEDIDWE